MPAKRSSMRKVKEVLRLRFELGFGQRQIAPCVQVMDVESSAGWQSVFHSTCGYRKLRPSCAVV